MSPYPSAVGTFLGDSVTSQSRYSMSTVTGMTVTSGSEAVTDFCRSFVDLPTSCLERAIAVAVDLEVVPLAVIADQERVSRLEAIKKVVESNKTSREGRSNPIPKNSNGDGYAYSQTKCCSECLGRNFLLPVAKTR